MTITNAIEELISSPANLKARRVIWVTMGDVEKHISLAEGYEHVVFKQYFANFGRRWMPNAADFIGTDWEVF